MLRFDETKRETDRLKKQATLKKDKHDLRDHLMLGKTPDTRVFLKPYASNVKNQGSANSCTAHAAMLVYETEQRILSRRWLVDGSEQHNYYYGRKYSNLFPADGGAYLRDSCKAMKTKGVCPEKLMPYNPRNINKGLGIFSNAFARFFRIKEYLRCTTVDAMKTSISLGHPVLLGVPIFNNWYSLRNKMIPLPSGNTIGGHAISIIGFDDALGFYIQNSWGEGWGNNGYGWLPYNYFDEIDWFDAWSIRI